MSSPEDELLANDQPELIDGRAVRAIGIGICDSSVVLTPVQQRELDTDLEILAKQANRPR